ncbi:MAG: hypothetical protein ACOC33_00475 [bacterium]
MDIKIGNIVNMSNNLNISKENYLNYVDNYDDIIETLPTLIFEWKKVKFLYPNQSILNHTIKNNKLYWTFSYNEKSETSIQIYNDFLENVFDYYFVPKYEYQILDPLFCDFNQINFKIEYDKIYQKEYFIYLQSSNKIIGINLKLLKFMEYDIKKIVDELKYKSNKYFFDKKNKKYNEISKYFNHNFLSLEKYIVTLI